MLKEFDGLVYTVNLRNSFEINKKSSGSFDFQADLNAACIIKLKGVGNIVWRVAMICNIKCTVINFWDVFEKKTFKVFERVF